ncbi:MAG: hypothetical protein HY961_06150 [Ignavibacteriae bacterium]|nr:hypothetical protein [Ignavibacteriota bacterium]
MAEPWNTLNCVSFCDANIGTAVRDQGTILRTTNGGAMWTRQSSGTTDRLNGVCFTDANTGTAVGNAGTILRTTNAGTSWTRQTSGFLFQFCRFHRCKHRNGSGRRRTDSSNDQRWRHVR